MIKAKVTVICDEVGCTQTVSSDGEVGKNATEHFVSAVLDGLCDDANWSITAGTGRALCPAHAAKKKEVSNAAKIPVPPLHLKSAASRKQLQRHQSNKDSARSTIVDAIHNNPEYMLLALKSELGRDIQRTLSNALRDVIKQLTEHSHAADGTVCVPLDAAKLKLQNLQKHETIIPALKDIKHAMHVLQDVEDWDECDEE